MKILIVDDESIVARALQRAFTSKGHEVTVAYSGEEGLDKWIEGEPDAVLLDVLMPGLTGPQVIEEYRNKKAKDYSAQVILMSAHAPAQDSEAVVFVRKPFENVFELVKRVEDLVGQQVGKTK